MKNLVDKYTSQQLREALNKRIEFEQKTETEEGEVARQQSVLFLAGKKFLLERHPNPACINLYEVDTSYYPTIKEDKWATVKLISSLYILNREDAEDIRIDDELRSDSKLEYSIFDNFKSNHRRDEKKYHSFHPDVVLSRIEEVSEELYRELVDSAKTILEVIEQEFEKVKA